MPIETLGDVVIAGPDRWSKASPGDLAKALEASGSAAGDHLLRFCEQVERWLHENDEDYAARNAWIGEVAGRFLSRLSTEDISARVASLASIQQQVRLLTLLARPPSAERLIFAARRVAGRMSAEAPEKEPSDSEAWVQHLLALVAVLGIAPHHPDPADFAGLWSSLPGWLVRGFFGALGRLSWFRSIELHLAYALPIASSEAIAALCDAWVQWQPWRLARLIEHVARSFSGLPRNVKPYRVREVLPSADQAESFIHLMVSHLHRRSPDVARRMKRFIDSVRHEQRESAQLFRAYLDASPANHEDVFDLLSTMKEPTDNRPPGWGRMSFTFSTHQSMRTSSIHVAQKHDFDPVDFDPMVVFRTASPAAITQMVLDQPSQEFAVKYLMYVTLGKNPHLSSICQDLCRNRVFVAKLRAAHDTLAVSVFEHGQSVARQNEEFRALLEDLAPTLIPRMPSIYLGNEAVYDAHDHPGRRELIQSEIERRLLITSDVKEVSSILHANGRWCPVERDELEAIFGRMQLDRLRPRGLDEPEELEAWATQMVHLTEVSSALALRIVARLSEAEIAALFARYEYFRTQKEEGGLWTEKRLRFKSVLVERWHALSAQAAAGALKEHFERDFWLFACGHPRAPNSLTAPSGEEFAAVAWLRLVEQVSPALVPTYLVNLLRHAALGLETNTAVGDLETASGFVGWWLAERGAIAEDYWKVLEERLDGACVQGPEAIAAVGLSGLDEGSAHVHALRQRVTQELASQLRLHPGAASRQKVSRFIRVLEREAPDLARILHSAIMGNSTGRKE